MKYESPFIVDYGDVREITAARNFRVTPDAEAPSEDDDGIPGEPGLDDTTGPCRADLPAPLPDLCNAQNP